MLAIKVTWKIHPILSGGLDQESLLRALRLIRQYRKLIYKLHGTSLFKEEVRQARLSKGFKFSESFNIKAACSVDNYESTRLRLVFGACFESLPHKVDSEAVNFAGDSSDTRWFYKKGDHEYAVLRFMGPLSGYQPKSHIGRISKIFLEYKCLSYSIGMRNFEKVPKNNILRA
ncbi:hypothetical protein CsatB_008176 [Cannabis sativa]